MGSFCRVLNLASRKMAELSKKISLSSPCEDWKMRKYISGISIIRFASFLAWTGLVTSVIFIIGSLDTMFSPLALGFHNPGCFDHDYMTFFCGSLYGICSAALVINIGMFIYSFKLWKAINSDNMMEMRKWIKIGCYIMGSLELTIAVAGILTPLFFIISPPRSFYCCLLPIPISYSVGFIVLISLMIHGVRKFKPTLVNIYIIFKIASFTIFAILTFFQMIKGLSFADIHPWLLGVNQLLLSGFFFFHSSGFMVAEYNIMLSTQTEEASLDLTHSRLQFSNNVYFHNDETTNNPI